MGLRDRISKRLQRLARRVLGAGPTVTSDGHRERTPAIPADVLGPGGIGVAEMHPAERAAAGLPLRQVVPWRHRSTVPEAAPAVPLPTVSAGSAARTAPAPPTPRPAADDLWGSFDFGSVAQEEFLPPPKPQVAQVPAAEPPPARAPTPPREVPSGPLSDDEKQEVKQKIIAAIKTVYDPEIPVDIWELGLVYGVEIAQDRTVEIRMTLTSPSCPSAQTLPAEVEQRSAEVEGVRSAMVDIVWEPPWGPHLMSEVAKLELNID